jgi:hypothetical protein
MARRDDGGDEIGAPGQSTAAQSSFDRLLRQFEMHAVYRTARKSGTPVPAVLVEKRGELLTAPGCLVLAHRHGRVAEEKVNRRPPTMIGE